MMDPTRVVNDEAQSIFQCSEDAPPLSSPKPFLGEKPPLPVNTDLRAKSCDVVIFAGGDKEYLVDSTGRYCNRQMIPLNYRPLSVLTRKPPATLMQTVYTEAQLLKCH
jgi:hypothetical protein